jgi:predicted amidophosphoribosyltransferase
MKKPSLKLNKYNIKNSYKEDNKNKQEYVLLDILLTTGAL